MTAIITPTHTIDLKSWLRVSIYEWQRQTDDLFHLGTLYGRAPACLGGQIAKVLKSRWKIAELRTQVDRERLELRVSLSATRELLMTFTTPGNQNRRSQAQWFGSFIRSVFSEHAQLLKTTSTF